MARRWLAVVLGWFLCGGVALGSSVTRQPKVWATVRATRRWALCTGLNVPPKSAMGTSWGLRFGLIGAFAHYLIPPIFGLLGRVSPLGRGRAVCRWKCRFRRLDHIQNHRQSGWRRLPLRSLNPLHVGSGG